MMLALSLARYVKREMECFHLTASDYQRQLLRLDRDISTENSRSVRKMCEGLPCRDI